MVKNVLRNHKDHRHIFFFYWFASIYPDWINLNKMFCIFSIRKTKESNKNQSFCIFEDKRQFHKLFGWRCQWIFFFFFFHKKVTWKYYMLFKGVTVTPRCRLSFYNVYRKKKCKRLNVKKRNFFSVCDRNFFLCEPSRNIFSNNFVKFKIQLK